MKRLLITGAGGFLGGRTAKAFAQRGQWSVVATSRRTDRAAELESHGCAFVAGDLCDAAHCDAITRDVDTVVHCAALSAPFGDYDTFFRSNVLATETLLAACIRNGVTSFVFISTPSIYFNYQDRFDVSEADPLPEPMVNHYASTKYLAEQHVLRHHGKGIATIALRPRAIIGAEDTTIFPRILEAYHRGKLKIVGDGQNRCDFTCAHNVIESIECAMNAPESAYGHAYNITDGEAVNFWEALNYALTHLGLQPPTQRVPKGLAMTVARILELKAILTRSKKEPPLTRYGVGILANHFTLDITRAKTQLSYTPSMSSYEGIDEYIAWHNRTH
jgi:2-alkyl-3-oxoalkanoate reductase